MIAEEDFNRLDGMASTTSNVVKDFERLLNARHTLNRFGLDHFPSLEMTKLDGNVIEARYAHTTVRFQLFFRINGDGLEGRVVCFHKYTLFDKVEYDFLGEFSVDQRGYTDLPRTTDNEPRRIDTFAGLIVLKYLKQAIESEPSKLSQAIGAKE